MYFFHHFPDESDETQSRLHGGKKWSIQPMRSTVGVILIHKTLIGRLIFADGELDFLAFIRKVRKK